MSLIWGASSQPTSIPTPSESPRPPYHVLVYLDAMQTAKVIQPTHTSPSPPPSIHPSIALQINLNAADYFLSVSVTHSRRSRLSTPSSIHPQCVYLIRMSFRLRVFTCSFVFFVSCALEKRWGVRIELQIYIEWEWQTPWCLDMCFEFLYNILFAQCRRRRRRRPRWLICIVSSNQQQAAAEDLKLTGKCWRTRKGTYIHTSTAVGVATIGEGSGVGY